MLGTLGSRDRGSMEVIMKTQNMGQQFDPIDSLLFNPYLLTLSFILLFVVHMMNLGEFFSGGVNIYLSFIITFLMPIMYLGWIFLVINYCSRVSYIKFSSTRKKAKFCIVYFFVIYSVIQLNEFNVINLAVLNFEGRMFFTIIEAIIRLIFIFSFFYLLWAASKMLIHKELGKSGYNWKFIGTYIQFLYLPLFIVFLHKRIKQSGIKGRE